MELVLFLLKVKLKLSLKTAETELYPLLDYLHHAHLSGGRVDKHVEVALEAILKRCHLEELEHKLVGINASAEIERELKAAEVDLVAEVNDLLELALFNEVGYLVKYRLDIGRVRDLNDINAVLCLVVVVARADLYRARAGLVDLSHILSIVEYRASAREVGRLDYVHDPVGRDVGVL